MERFRLERSQQIENWWVLTDTENLVVVRFQEGKFNETQKFTDLEGNDTFASLDEVMMKIRIMREMSDWLAINHYKIAMG